MTQYFTDDEMQCNCGCGLINVPPGFLKRLNTARHYSGVPYIITSWCRCFKHNKKPGVGGSPTSSHLKGIAVDIQARSNIRRFAIIAGLLFAGFTRIGIGKTFIHADLDHRKAQKVMWLY